MPGCITASSAKRRTYPLHYRVCAEFHWPELLDRLEERIYIAENEVADVRNNRPNRYQAVQDYSNVVQDSHPPRKRLELYIKYAPMPVFGAKRYWCRYEFAKSRGQIHFHMFAICGDKRPRRLLRELRGGGA